MTEAVLKHIEEHVIPDKRLGRHIEHDPRSREHAYGVTLAPAAYVRVHHRVYGGVLNQGDVGSCTGNATAGAINTAGLHVVGHTALKEPDALGIYELATSLDEFEGAYPPDDTGSSGLSAAKSAKQKTLIGSYQHAFNMEAALTALQKGPVITGVDWYEGFDSPSSTTGLVKPTGQVRGGHEIVAIGFEPHAVLSDSLVFLQNSWGREWGLAGRFCWTVSTWQKLLNAQGDATILLK